MPSLIIGHHREGVKRYVSGYCPLPIVLLLRLAVEAVFAAARAELVELQAVRVVALVLGARVVALFALGASQIDYDAVGFLCHLDFLLDSTFQT
jgi:hypothetical protein